MSKTLLHKIFGFGKIPKRYLTDIRQEGIVLMDEGIGGTVTFRNFRAPGRRYSWRRNWFTGSVIITWKRFWAFTLFRPIISVPLDSEQLKDLHCSLKDETTLRVIFDAAKFNEKWSGTIECRFSTPKARLFLERIKKKTAEL